MIMSKNSTKSHGYSLIIGSVLLILTMLLHPTGGSIEHIAHIAKVAIISHSLAILSIVFIAYGFWGLTRLLGSKHNLAYLAFSFITFGLIAVMFAALLNGLVVPIYASKHLNETAEQLKVVKLVLDYSLTFNKVLDYVFIAVYSAAMLIWSIIIVNSSVIPKWVGFLGIIIVIVSIAALSFKINFISVTAFAIYIFSIVLWIITSGYFLIRLSKKIIRNETK